VRTKKPKASLLDEWVRRSGKVALLDLFALIEEV
jgi:hypothetical protein